MRQVILYQDEDEVWIVECPSLPGCHSFGMTYEEALTNIKDAIALWLEVSQDYGDEILPDTPIFVAAVDV
jgi:predicted RNase H-like HicB family nuclease